MAKRMIDSDIFKKQRWFKQLKPEHKLAFFYMLTNCDHAGIWRIDILDLCEDCGFESFDLEEFIEAINTNHDSWTGKKVLKRRFMIVHEKYLWMTGYIQYQCQGKNQRVNPNSPPVESALKILKGYGLYEFALENFFIILSKDQNNPLEGLPNPSDTPNRGTEGDKEKEKDREREKEKDKEKENTFEKSEKLLQADATAEPKTETPSSKAEQSKRFKPPTFEEAKSYFEQQGHKNPSHEAEKFVNFYQSKDWHVGKTKMKDWQAAVRGWILKQKNYGNTTHRQGNKDPAISQGIGFGKL